MLEQPLIAQLVQKIKEVREVECNIHWDRDKKKTILRNCGKFFIKSTGGKLLIANWSL